MNSMFKTHPKVIKCPHSKEGCLVGHVIYYIPAQQVIKQFVEYMDKFDTSCCSEYTSCEGEIKNSKEYEALKQLVEE